MTKQEGMYLLYMHTVQKYTYIREGGNRIARSNSHNKTEIVVFSIPLQCLLPEDYITRLYSHCLKQAFSDFVAAAHIFKNSKQSCYVILL